MLYYYKDETKYSYVCNYETLLTKFHYCLQNKNVAIGSFLEN